jgi:hypothetical protein
MTGRGSWRGDHIVQGMDVIRRHTEALSQRSALADASGNQPPDGRGDEARVIHR